MSLRPRCTSQAILERKQQMGLRCLPLALHPFPKASLTRFWCRDPTLAGLAAAAAAPPPPGSSRVSPAAASCFALVRVAGRDPPLAQRLLGDVAQQPLSSPLLPSSDRKCLPTTGSDDAVSWPRSRSRHPVPAEYPIPSDS